MYGVSNKTFGRPENAKMCFVIFVQGYGVKVPDGAGAIDWKGLKERRDKYAAWFVRRRRLAKTQ